MMFLSVMLAAAAPAAATKPTTIQAQFDAANAAFDEMRCKDAVAGYAALEHAPAIVRNPLARATVAVRKGTCLVRTGHVAEGETMVRSGLPVLEAKGAEFAADVRDARLALSGAARLRFDYDGAIAEAEKSLTLSTGVQRVPPLLVLSALTMFDGDGRALRYAEEARTAIAAAKTAKTDVAAVQTQYARVLLNAGRTKEAYAMLKDSLAKQGGLGGSRINIDDVATRSDLAIAALLTGDKDSARQYLAYTNAGRISDLPFSFARSMDAPTCDPAIGLKPSDVAVVEFSLGEDGRVVSALPVYVTGNRAAAIAFARAVAGWSWRAEEAIKIKPFYRALTRVELRCSNAADVPGTFGPLSDAVKAWLFDGEPARPWSDMSDAGAAPLQRAALAAAPAGSRAQLVAVDALISNESLPIAERREFAARAIPLAQSLRAPVAVRAAVALSDLNMRALPAAKWDAAIREMLADPAFLGDPLTAATLRLAIASAYTNRKSPPDASALFDAVIDEPALAEHHPLKVNALLRKANLLAAAGDPAEADATFRRTGLTAEQCAMLGVTPAMRSSGASSTDFPQEAMQWGFEGWVRTEFDIAADGRTAQQRALIAYPPFVFDDAATGIAKQSRWTSSYRPGGSVACAASAMSVRFMLPFH